MFKGANDAFEEYYNHTVGLLRKILRKYSLKIIGDFEFPEFDQILAFSPTKLIELLKSEDSFDLCESVDTASGATLFSAYEAELMKLIASKGKHQQFGDDADLGPSSSGGWVESCVSEDTAAHCVKGKRPKYARYSCEEFHVSLRNKLFELFSDTMVHDLVLPSLHAHFDLIHKMLANFLVFIDYVKRRTRRFAFDKRGILDEDRRFVCSFRGLDLDGLYMKVIKCGTEDMRSIAYAMVSESREATYIN